MVNAELHDIREGAVELIARLPHAKEYFEWSKQLDDAQTEDEVLNVVNRLAYLVQMYAFHRGMFIPRNPPFPWMPQR